MEWMDKNLLKYLQNTLWHNDIELKFFAAYGQNITWNIKVKFALIQDFYSAIGL